MAFQWNYPNTSQIKFTANTDKDGYLITSEESTPTGAKTLNFKGYKTPLDDEDADAETSHYRSFVDVIVYGLFGLETAVPLNSGKAALTAVLEGEPTA